MRLFAVLAVLGAVALFAVIIAFIPYSFTALPECRILVTNSSGKPVDNAEVYETGVYFDLGQSWGEKKVTDRGGKVTFQARTLTVTLAQRVISRLVARHYLHLLTGQPRGLVSVCDEGRYAEREITGQSNGNIKLVLVMGPCRRS